MSGKAGRPPKIGDQDREILVGIAREFPSATLAELRDRFEQRSGIRAHEKTIRKNLVEAGFSRRFGDDAVRVTKAPESPRRYGYTDDHRRIEPEQTYPSCLTDAEWELSKDLFENDGRPGKPPSYSRRQMVNACCYVVRTGCSWRQLPKDFPPWKNVYRTFRRWSDQGRFEQLHDRLREMWRVREDREAEPTAAVIDAQSTRSSPQGGESGFDAGKKVKGRKRHIVTDTLGLLLAVSVTAASVQDRDGAHPVIEAAMKKCPSVQKLYVDSGYAGRCAQTVSQLHGIDVEVVRHPASRNMGRWSDESQEDLFTVSADATGFVVQAKRWVIERTHAWNERARRLVMHHDRLSKVSEAWVWLTEARLLMRRLAH